MTVYLDSNATTQPLPEAIEAAREAMTSAWANPSSIHRPGQEARRRVELARQSVARLIGARPREIVFTSGGTESIDLAIRGALTAHALTRSAASPAPAKPPIIISTAIEHSAVRTLLDALSKRGEIELRLIPLLEGGVVDAEALPALIEDGRTALVNVQWANNETGAIHPIERIGAICRERRVPFHADGVQWVGKAPADVKTAPFDLLSFSAHKFHGPKGAGGVWVRHGARLSPVINGSQENGRRGGTENVPGIAGMGAAAAAQTEWLADPANPARIEALRDRLERGILKRVPEAVVNGPTSPGSRVCNTSNIAFPRLESEALLIAFSERGLSASAGPACSSGSLDPSPVLLAMGIPAEHAHGAIRFSLSRFTTEQEIESAIDTVVAAVDRLKKSMPTTQPVA